MKTAILAVLTVICTFISYSPVQSSNNNTSIHPDEILYSDVTYQRVYHDNMWWIVVYQDGVKINEYPDIDAL